jgi:hypothetical protein
MTDSHTPQADDRLVPLTEGGLELELSEMESLSVKTLLEANGIQVIVQGASQMPNLPYEILVPANQLNDAVRIITEAEKDGPAAADEAAGQ